MACAPPPSPAVEEVQAVECMARILRTMSAAQDVQIGSKYDRNERRSSPTMSYRFVNSAGPHRVEIEVGGSAARGYGYFVHTTLPFEEGNPLSRQVTEEWFRQCQVDGISIVR